jgi:hypothetical protein
MLMFIAVLAGGIGATLFVQALDVECVNEQKAVAPQPVRHAKEAFLNAIGATR